VGVRGNPPNAMPARLLRAAMRTISKHNVSAREQKTRAIKDRFEEEKVNYKCLLQKSPPLACWPLPWR
jgi:hypothetical protein